MNPLFIATPDGQLIAGAYIVSLDVQGAGTEDQLRFEVQATLVTGERQALQSFKGAGAHGQAAGFIADLLTRLGAQVYNPRETVGGWGVNLAGTFASTAGDVGMLQQVTYFLLFVTVLAFFGAFVFFLNASRRVAPEHRAGLVLHAVVCGVAGLSYLRIQDDFRHLLHVLAGTPDAGERLSLIRTAWVAVGQTRYMDWTVTTPLLLLGAVLVLRVRSRHVLAPIIWMLLADLFMVFTGYIGENQITRDGVILAGPRLVWGAVSTVGYLVVVYILFTRFRGYQRAATRQEEHAFKLASLSTVTTWGVYPIGYALPALFTHLNLNWLHLAYSLADLVNKIGIGVVVYWAAASLVERLHPSQDNPLAREENPEPA